jgi:tetratricopeptide (TPR) repeat protein
VQTLTPPTRIIDLPASANIAVTAALHGDYLSDDEKYFDSVMSISMALELKNNLEKSPKYSSYIFPVYTINAGEKGLTEENIRDTKESANANYLISVEEFKSAFHRQRVKNRITNSVRIVMPYSLTVRIYNVDNFAPVDERLISDTLTVQVDIHEWETEEELIARLPDNKAAISMAIKEIAKKYTEEIIPFWSEETRFYYLDNNMAQAEEYIDDEDWSKAMNVWMKYVDAANRDLAAIACFNMAVGCEMLGEYELALKWIENVKRKNENYYWGEYKNRLEKRIEEKAIIDRIMN